MSQKRFAGLWQSLQKVKPDSTLCNASCNKNFARGMLHLPIQLVTSVETKLQNMLQDKLHSETAP